jgi:coniferyl-aldehyde dehydrogenase
MLAPPLQALRERFEAARAAFRAEPFASYEVRADRLQRLLAVVLDRQHEFADAIDADFGGRSRHETLIAETFVTGSAIRYILKNLRAWMRPEKRGTALGLQPASARIVPQPLGVVGIVSPWNYPVQLALVPLAYALAAGDRAILKPSELTPRTGALLRDALAAVFPADLVSVVEGGADVGAAFCELPWDHLVYTGSTRVGRLVMQAAAKNLVPVTLELGGKSPAIVHPDYPLDRAAESIAAGKLLNAGQTCVAPDYVLVTHERAEALQTALLAAMKRLYPRLVDNPDYTAVVNEHHLRRIRGLVDEAVGRGATATVFDPASESFAGTTKMAPVLLRGVTDDMHVMQEEIFGPVLPIVSVGSVDEAIRYVADHPRPLALYYFDRDGDRIDDLLRRTHSGGVTINDCALHVAEEHLPFGGVGPSGMGAYHGKEGFDALSHRKAVLHQSRMNTRFLTLPPYTDRTKRIVDFLL